MHLTLTDWLTCPKCGPLEGLIVLAERLEDRRVIEGALGCPACRTQYPVRSGVADLRTGVEEGGLENSGQPIDDPLRLAAFLGITEGRGYVLVLGANAVQAQAIAAHVPGLELIAIGPGVDRGVEQQGVNRLLVDATLPFRDRSVRGAVVGPAAPSHLVQEALRVLAVGGRLVMSLAQPGAEETTRINGVRELARDANHAVLMRQH